MDSMKAPELKRIGRLSGRNVPYPESPHQAATCKCTHSCTSIPPPPFQIESWRQASRGRMAVVAYSASRPAIRDRISTLELFYTFSLPAPAQASSSCLLSLRVNTSSGPGAVLSVECVEVWGSGWCAVEKADLEPVQLGGNQLYQDEFLCPEALAGASSGPPDGASCAPDQGFTSRGSLLLPGL